MAVKIILEKKPIFRERCEQSAYTKKTIIVKSAQYGNDAFETKYVDYSDFSFVAEGKRKNIRFTGNVPFSRTGSKILSFSKFKLPWLQYCTGDQNQNERIDDLCRSIVSAINESGAECIMVKCTQFWEQKESFNYPVKQIDDTLDYDFFINYKSCGSSHYYNFKTPSYPRLVSEIANLQYMLQLDTIDLPVRADKVTASSMILSPDALTNTLSFLLWNKSNYQKKRKRKYFDSKLTFSSDPYNPRHAGTEKTVDGKKARVVTLIKDGVLRHLPLNREESKKAGQKYIPNAFRAFELKGGAMPLEAMLKNTQDALFIYELRGDIGDDGSYSGIIKNGLILRNGKFTERLLNAQVYFNIFDIYNNIEDISSEQVSLGNFLAPYIKFHMKNKNVE
ncbi:MAG: hypothetical protein LBI28_07555 [Treponema sp.]|jgi:hypothetical protein|nr:hypothetical protein [Treponema sp.]